MLLRVDPGLLSRQGGLVVAGAELRNVQGARIKASSGNFLRSGSSLRLFRSPAHSPHQNRLLPISFDVPAVLRA